MDVDAHHWLVRSVVVLARSVTERDPARRDPAQKSLGDEGPRADPDAGVRGEDLTRGNDVVSHELTRRARVVRGVGGPAAWMERGALSKERQRLGVDAE